MPIEVRLIVTDAAPLIVLAAAECLDYLLLPDLPIIVPDAVFYEATYASDKVGAAHILDWYAANRPRVRVEPTEAFQRAIAEATERGVRLARHLGEAAAVEYVRREPLLFEEGSVALLLCDDRDAERLFSAADQVVLLTTSDYLRQLEEAGRIQSADHVLERARSAGLNPSSRDVWHRHDPAIRDAVRVVLATASERERDPS